MEFSCGLRLETYWILTVLGAEEQYELTVPLSSAKIENPSLRTAGGEVK